MAETRMKTETESASEYEAMFRRFRDKVNGVQVKRKIDVKYWPLREWITTRDLARLVQLEPAQIYTRLDHRSDVERKKVSVPLMSDGGKAFTTRITAWRWKQK